MKHVKTVMALAAAIIFAASFTAGNPYFAYAQDIDTPAKASLSAAADTSGEAEAVSGVSEEASGPEIYAGEYIMFGLGDMETNFQNKKVVVSNEGMESGSIILNADGTGLAVDGAPGEDAYQEAITGWSVSDDKISITGESFEFTGTIEDGVMMIGYESYSDTFYFALESADLSDYTIVDDVEYERLCMAGTYYLTNETMADGSTFLSRTQISLNVLNGLGEASLKLYEDGTGALDVGDHRDISWDTDKIILNGGEYDLDLEDGVIIVDMKDYTMEFSYIGERDTYLQLNLGDIQDSVSAIPGSFSTLGETGLMLYVPTSYISSGLTDEDISNGYLLRNVEQVDANGSNVYDNAIYVSYYYDDESPSIELLAKKMDTFDFIQALYPIMINGRHFLYVETLEEGNGSFRYYLFYTIDDKGYTTRIAYIIEHGITADDSRELVYKLAAAIYPAG